MGLVCFTRVNDFRRTTRHCGLLYGIYKHMHDIWGYYFPTLGFEQLYYYTFPFGILDWGIMRFIILCYFSLICCLSLSIGWVVILYYFTLQLITVQYDIHFITDLSWWLDGFLSVLLYCFTLLLIIVQYRYAFMFIFQFRFLASCIPYRLLWIFPEQISAAVGPLRPTLVAYRQHSGW